MLFVWVVARFVSVALSLGSFYFFFLFFFFLLFLCMCGFMLRRGVGCWGLVAVVADGCWGRWGCGGGAHGSRRRRQWPMAAATAAGAAAGSGGGGSGRPLLPSHRHAVTRPPRRRLAVAALVARRLAVVVAAPPAARGCVGRPLTAGAWADRQSRHHYYLPYHLPSHRHPPSRGAPPVGWSAAAAAVSTTVPHARMG